MRVVYLCAGGLVLAVAAFAGGAYWQMKNLPIISPSASGVFGKVVAIDPSFIKVKLAGGQQETFHLTGQTNFVEVALPTSKNVSDIVVGASVQVFADEKTNSVKTVQVLPATSLTPAPL